MLYAVRFGVVQGLVQWELLPLEVAACVLAVVKGMNAAGWGLGHPVQLCLGLAVLVVDFDLLWAGFWDRI